MYKKYIYVYIKLSIYIQRDSRRLEKQKFADTSRRPPTTSNPLPGPPTLQCLLPLLLPLFLGKVMGLSARQLKLAPPGRLGRQTVDYSTSFSGKDQMLDGADGITMTSMQVARIFFRCPQSLCGPALSSMTEGLTAQKCMGQFSVPFARWNHL